ncbi:MAG: tRNA (N(6)-L-threonylcarbamoyladenosine(37)-C(2))-methylthiotransferase MtaB [Syntrophaceae bacterium]|nr:tRNA (N(6)-L-threonylcarbamoyladenosine(37)-C(2))-methylthiotransferase MtaB [Syntrophaceae bacterium]
MTTVAIATLGCKVNQFESEALMSALERRGYSLVSFGEGADVMIINTCTVTHRADFQSRQMIRRAHRSNPQSLIIVTGCYSQVEPEEIERVEATAYLLGNKEKLRIPDLLPLMQKGETPKVQVSDIQEERLFEETALPSFYYHTRAFLKIQDGCDARCSYCIVPHARGRGRSLPPGRVIEHLRALKGRGFSEVVLTGIHIGSYGIDLNPASSLEELLKSLEHEETPCRIRLSSIEPLDFSRGLLSFLISSKKVCPHLHLPIQSGDDEILRKMNRPYGRSLISELIHELHENLPEASLGADVIVGFPGETEERFRRTYDLIESLPLSYLHIFPFSRRKGTPASQLPQQVSEGEIKKRAGLMRQLGKRKRQAFYRQSLNKELRVLVEDRRGRETDRWRGLSRNYIPVLLAGRGSERGADWVNREWTVRVTRLEENGVIGEVVER